MYIHIYIYMCVCVCVCVCIFSPPSRSSEWAKSQTRSELQLWQSLGSFLTVYIHRYVVVYLHTSLKTYVLSVYLSLDTYEIADSERASTMAVFRVLLNGTYLSI